MTIFSIVIVIVALFVILVVVVAVLTSPTELGRTPDNADLCNFGGVSTTLWTLNISGIGTSVTCTSRHAPISALPRGSAAYTDTFLPPLDISTRDEGRATIAVA